MLLLLALFCRYFSHDINATAEQGGLTLLQAWNEEDFDRLQKNLIAHVLMKRRLKQADTLFFALTDEEDLLLSILLETGEVVRFHLVYVQGLFQGLVLLSLKIDSLLLVSSIRFRLAVI